MTADALDGTPTSPRQTEPALRPAQRLSAAIETGRQRIVISALVFSVTFGAIGLKLIDLMAFGGDADSAMATHALPAAAPAADRADLRDRNGLILATTLPSMSLYADPKMVIDPIEASLRLAKVLPDLDQAKLLADLSSERRFVWLKRGLTPAQQYEINRLGIPGLAFQAEERRYYPAGGLTSHVVGGMEFNMSVREFVHQVRPYGAPEPLVDSDQRRCESSEKVSKGHVTPVIATCRR